jgi:hypothetical protein
VDPKENRKTIEREKGTLQTYDPRRLSGLSVHREVEHEFSTGDRIQFTAPSKKLKVASRELRTIERISSESDLVSAWTRYARFDSTSVSTRTSTTDTQ